jgi:hypothetical protein
MRAPAIRLALEQFPMGPTTVDPYVLALIGRKLLSIIGLEQLYPDRDRPGAIASDRMLL